MCALLCTKPCGVSCQIFIEMLAWHYSIHVRNTRMKKTRPLQSVSLRFSSVWTCKFVILVSSFLTLGDWGSKEQNNFPKVTYPIRGEAETVLSDFWLHHAIHFTSVTSMAIKVESTILDSSPGCISTNFVWPGASYSVLLDLNVLAYMVSIMVCWPQRVVKDCVRW